MPMTHMHTDAGGNTQSIAFYNEHCEIIEIEKDDIVYIGKIFAIVRMPHYRGENVVGLFIEDDGIYFMKFTFSDYWLGDLKDVAEEANIILKLSKIL